MKWRVVLNTRPRDQAAELSRLLGTAGFEVVEAPAIAIVPAWEASELDRVRRDLASGRYMWVVLQSANAGHGLEPLLAGVRLVCGVATATHLGLSAEIQFERFSASAALDALRSRVTGSERVLVPRAAEGRDELVLGLTATGVAVDAPVAYRTVLVDDAARQLRTGRIDVVAVCSPSAAQSVAGAVQHDTLVVCLGETTADAARAAGLRVDGVAASTSMAALVTAIEVSLGVRV